MRPLLIGHRGARCYAPENTIDAFALALEHGCDGIEFDVRATADGRAIVFHNSRVGWRVIARNPYSRLGNVITLEQVLALFSPSAYMHIELKAAGAEDELLAALRAHPPQRDYLVASFFPHVLAAVHARDVKIPLGFICSRERELPRWRELPVCAVVVKHTLIKPELVEELHAAGKQVFVWTVNKGSEMQALARMGVEGIVSDDTKLMVKLLGQRDRRTTADPSLRSG